VGLGQAAEMDRSVNHADGVCDCDLEARTAGLTPGNARARGFVELEVIHLPEHRTIIYSCARCARRFEGFHERGSYRFLPVLGGE